MTVDKTTMYIGESARVDSGRLGSTRVDSGRLGGSRWLLQQGKARIREQEKKKGPRPYYVFMLQSYRDIGLNNSLSRLPLISL